ncbi:MAG TPA: low molecular weight phosphatase family protein [Candidatus Acidoferrum sp.]|nr:low molecular weight phosphatase family protein [Candidatus Acidoferrum sp.]
MNHHDKIRVLFVCIGNACRSPMGEAIAAKDAADVIAPSSAGLYPMGMIPEMTQSTLESNGYSANGLRSKGLQEIVPEEIDLVINMSGYRRAQPLEKFAQVENWEVSDPYGADKATYQRILEQIRERVKTLALRLRKEQRAAV